MTLKVDNRQQMIYQATNHVPFFMMNDEERHLSIFSLWFWRVGSVIICYFYHFSYLYMTLYQFYAFSRPYIFEINPYHMDESVDLREG